MRTANSEAALRRTGAKHIFTVLCAFMFVFCLINSERISEESLLYLKLCGTRVVPALFVCSVLGGVICSDTAFYRLCALPFFGTEAAVLAMGLLGGFPLGAAAAAGLYDDGLVSRRQAEYLCAFANVPSLSFIAGYTGNALGSRKSGLILAALTALTALLTALLMKFLFLDKSERYIKPAAGSALRRSFPEILSQSCLTMLTVCGCIVFFGSISVSFPREIRGFFEMSGGINSCNSPTKAAVLLGFSGLSVIMQTAAVCENRFSVRPYICAKLMQSAFMGAAAYLVFGY